MNSLSTSPSLRRQAGVVLVIALIVLVAMTLAGIALVRSVDITTQIAGNLAFRQSGTQAADAGIEVARKWLLTTSADVTQAGPTGSGYFATFNGGVTSTPAIFNPATFDWTTYGAPPLPEDSSGNIVTYVIHRMCETTGNPGTANCVTAPQTAPLGGSNTDPEYGKFGCVSNYCNASNSPMYRITTRVVGPRNTVTYTQSVVY